MAHASSPQASGLFVSATAFSSPSSSNSGSNHQVIRRNRSSFTDIFKLLVLGDSAVGKTALIVRCITKKFIGEYENNVDIKYRHSELIENNQVLLEICDSIGTGSDNFRSQSAANSDAQSNWAWLEEGVRWAEGFVLVYDVTRMTSFEFVMELRSRIMDLRRVGALTAVPVPMVIVGNKIDLEHRRDVSFQHVVEQIATDSSVSVMEISVAGSYEQSRDVFRVLCREILSTKRRSRTFLDRVLGGIVSSAHRK